MPIALRSASRTSAIILGRDHQSRRPSRARATYSFIDQPRAEDTFLTQSVSLNESRKETIAFSSVTGFLGTVALYAVAQYKSTSWSTGCGPSKPEWEQGSFDG